MQLNILFPQLEDHLLNIPLKSHSQITNEEATLFFPFRGKECNVQIIEKAALITEQ